VSLQEILGGERGYGPQAAEGGAIVPCGWRPLTTGIELTTLLDAYERVSVNATPAEAVAALRDALSHRGIREYAVVDHGHDMAAAGVPGVVAWTLVFGNPAAGAKLLARDLRAAIDIPLRLAVIAGSGGGAEIVLRNMRSLLGADLADLADAFTTVLRGLAHEVQDRYTG
jgi:uncharacterized protein (DUF302 family)